MSSLPYEFTLHKRRAVWRVTAAAAAIVVLLIGVTLWNNGGDWQAFIRYYDGQLFFEMAIWDADAIAAFPDPAYRLQRLFYPLLAGLLGFGQPDAVAVAMVLINAAGVIVSAGSLAYLLGRLGAPPLLALTYVVWGGTLHSLRLALAEPLAIALALVAIIAYVHDRRFWTVALLIAAGLTRETGLVFAGALALHAFNHQQKLFSGLLLIAPVVPFLTIYFVLNTIIPAPVINNPALTFSVIPFVGIAQDDNLIEQVMSIMWVALPAGLLLLATGHTLWQRRSISLTSAVMLACGAFVLVIPPATWQDPAAIYRIASPLIIGGLLYTGQHRRRWQFLLAIWWQTSIVLYFLLLSRIVIVSA